ncbi:hypothetical protein [Pseudomonas frederiksbergensis]|uniref:Secreted protein n=1 Tax=Pseudomonas frederiksbergensis TaxID=104087 RepID=A0A423KL76_9PSED|nr:hypothetical protein [Pseudomonas frederiksbergensis]RON54626.1 hypothetical protein BK665_09870 [Pseudomonas frederiksbergensis]
MSIFQRIVFLLKVLVMLSVGMSAAWADCPAHGEQASSGQVAHTGMMIAKSASEGGDQGQGGSADDDDSTTEEPDTDDDDEGDSQS